MKIVESGMHKQRLTGLNLTMWQGHLFVRPAIPLIHKQPVFNGSKADFDSTSAIGISVLMSATA